MATTIKASQQGLEIVDQKRRKKGWNKQSSSWCTEAKTSVSSLKRFWQREAIQQDAFVTICEAVGVEDWEQIIDQSSPQQTYIKPEWFAYDDVWVGRERFVAELTQKVQEQCRLLFLVGITGIGKTALAEKLAVELDSRWLQRDWSKFHLENFENDQQANDFSSVAIRWLEKWGEYIAPDDYQNQQQLVNRLIKRLRENQYLVVMDSLENILEGNEDDGWNNFQDEWWVKFFESLLATESFQSRIILTSQDFPGQMPERYKNFFHCQALSGLTASEQLELFDKTGLDVETDSTNRPYLERIGAAYEGHPLALRVIAGEIGDKPFFGNVVAYWNKYGKEVEEVEMAIEEVKTQGIIASADDQWRLDRYTRKLRQNVRERLEKTFERLKKDMLNAYLLLCESSIYRCGVKEDFWLSHLEDWNCNKDEQEIALLALRDRYLVEEVVENEKLLLRQHNLIRSVALKHQKYLDKEDE